MLYIALRKNAKMMKIWMTFWKKKDFDGRICLWVVPDMSQDHTVDVYEFTNDFFWKNVTFPLWTLFSLECASVHKRHQKKCDFFVQLTFLISTFSNLTIWIFYEIQAWKHYNFFLDFMVLTKYKPLFEKDHCTKKSPFFGGKYTRLPTDCHMYILFNHFALKKWYDSRGARFLQAFPQYDFH